MADDGQRKIQPQYFNNIMDIIGANTTDIDETQGDFVKHVFIKKYIIFQYEFLNFFSIKYINQWFSFIF